MRPSSFAEMTPRPELSRFKLPIALSSRSCCTGTPRTVPRAAQATAASSSSRAAQGHTAEGGIVVVVIIVVIVVPLIIIVVIVVIIVHLSLQIRLSNRLQLDREAITAKPRQVGHLTRRSEQADVLELLDVYLDV
eukprot:scaffold933_cov56-Phaeocystis_antarctica.AAC.2